MPAPDSASSVPACRTETAVRSPARLSWADVFPFYAASAVLAILAVVALLLSLEIWPRNEIVPEVVRRWAFEAAVVLVVVSLGLFLWPRVLSLRLRHVVRLADVLHDVVERTADLEAVRKELYRCRSAVEGVAQLHETEREYFVEHRRFLLEHVNLADELHKARLEAAAVRKQLDRWCEAACGYAAQFERLLEGRHVFGDETRRTMSKLLEGFVRSVSPLGVQLIRPEPNQPFDARIHRLVGEEETTAVAAGHVLSCRQWGLQYGTEVKRPAEVVVAKSPAAPRQVKTPSASSEETSGPGEETVA